MSSDNVSETNACSVFWIAPKKCLPKTLPAKVGNHTDNGIGPYDNGGKVSDSNYYI